MGFRDELMTDDAKLISALLRSQLAEPAWKVAEMAGVDPDHAERRLAEMAGDLDYPVLRRRDLGPDVYEATEDSTRAW
jgi:hypothetical protein